LESQINKDLLGVKLHVHVLQPFWSIWYPYWQLLEQCFAWHGGGAEYR